MNNALAGYTHIYNENARLCILRGLHEQPSRRLSDSMLISILQAYAIDRGRDYLHQQLNWLENEAGCVRLIRSGDAVIAELTETGEDHVERRTVLPGIKRPSATRV